VRGEGESADAVRERLIETSRALFVRRGFGEVSVREIARAAGVTPAMIAYYFGDKQGLYEAMLGSVFDTLLARVRELAAQSPASTAPIEAFIRLYVGTIAAQPWLPGLLLREVLTGDSAVRARFVERFAARAAALLPGLVSGEIAGGALRADLDPKQAVLSLVGMCVFPFLAHPVTGKALGYELDPAFAERLVAHASALFLDGARPRPAP
jgi:AcrR family transcriptional regulator